MDAWISNERLSKRRARARFVRVSTDRQSGPFGIEDEKIMPVDRGKGAVTPEKKLLAGISVWRGSSGTSMSVSKLVDSIRADVVVVGAGISGAFMAHALAGRYERVVVVDRRVPIHGSTSVSTAMLQFEIDQPLTKLGEKNWRPSRNASLAPLLSRNASPCITRTP